MHRKPGYQINAVCLRTHESAADQVPRLCTARPQNVHAGVLRPRTCAGRTSTSARTNRDQAGQLVRGGVPWRSGRARRHSQPVRPHVADTQRDQGPRWVSAISEVVEHVIKAEAFTEEQQAVKRGPGDHMSKIEYRLAWARNGLKLIGALENSARGVWSITESGRTSDRPRRSSPASSSGVPSTTANTTRHESAMPLRAARLRSNSMTMRHRRRSGVGRRLADRLLRTSPAVFERLAQRVLREGRTSVMSRCSERQATVASMALVTCGSRSFRSRCTSSASGTGTPSARAMSATSVAQ